MWIGRMPHYRGQIDVRWSGHPGEKYGWQSWARWQVSIWKVALNFTAIHDKCMYITCGLRREKSLKLFDKLQPFFLQWKRGQWGWNLAGHLTHITYIYQKRISLIGLCFVSRDRITWSNTVTAQHRTTTKKLGKIVAILPCKSHLCNLPNCIWEIY
jgi:hypothetical protein